jgi:hypothetical protein
MTSLIRSSTIALAVVASLSSSSLAQIIATSNIDELCKSSPPLTSRHTIVYVDLFSIKRGESEWGLTLLNKLELGPREPLTIVGVNSSSFEITDAFEACYPTLTKSEMDGLRKSRSWSDSLIKLDPESQQKENLQTFDARLRNALDSIIGRADKLGVAKRRNILGAIAVDKNRFRDRDAYYRIVIYTDGNLVDSEAGTDEAQLTKYLSQKYPSSFGGAEVSIYGVTDAGMPLETKSRIFSSFFLANGGRVQSILLSLPQQRIGEFLPALNIAGTFEGGGTKGAAKLRVTQVRGVPASDVWVTFIAGSSSLHVPFEGNYTCANDTCTIKATCLENIPFGSTSPYFRKGDNLTLTGKMNGKLEGAVKSEAPETFKDGAGDARYTVVFSER